MKTLDENGNERKAQDIRFSSFLYFIKNNDFDQLIEDNVRTKKNEILKLKSKKINFETEFDTIIEEVLISENIKILGEMKIVYGYKNFEIALKHFLSVIYSKFDKKKASNKKYLRKFFKEENIELDDIRYVLEIDQLRRVNNAIKHSSILEAEEIHNIPEFHSKEILEYTDILNFYNRVAVIIPGFFIDLRCKILAKINTKTSNLKY